MTVLLGKLLVVEVVDQADDAPLLLVLAVLAGQVAHDRLDGSGVIDQRGALVVLLQQGKGLLARWDFFTHGLVLV